MSVAKVFQILFIYTYIGNSYLFVDKFSWWANDRRKKNISKFFDSLLFVIFRATVPRANHVMMSVCDSYASLWGSKRWYFLPPRDTMRFCRKQLTAPSNSTCCCCCWFDFFPRYFSTIAPITCCRAMAHVWCLCILVREYFRSCTNVSRASLILWMKHVGLIFSDENNDSLSRFISLCI